MQAAVAKCTALPAIAGDAVVFHSLCFTGKLSGKTAACNCLWELSYQIAPPASPPASPQEGAMLNRCNLWLAIDCCSFTGRNKLATVHFHFSTYVLLPASAFECVVSAVLVALFCFGLCITAAARTLGLNIYARLLQEHPTAVLTEEW